MEWDPNVKVDVEQVKGTVPEFVVPDGTVAVQAMSDPLSMNWTVPVSGPLAELETVAVKVTLEPKADGLPLVAKAIVVGLTVNTAPNKVMTAEVFAAFEGIAMLPKVAVPVGLFGRFLT
jgi:hypothetical protein